MLTASEAASDRRVRVPVQLGRHRRSVLGVRQRDSRLCTGLPAETLLGLSHTLNDVVCLLYAIDSNSTLVNKSVAKKYSGPQVACFI